MASIQSLGVGSGLLTSELVDDIIAAEREAKDLRIEAEKAELEARISAFGGIKSVLDGLRSSTASIASSDNLLLKTAFSSNEAVVGATATSSATPGVHTVEVSALARAHTLTTTRFDGIDDVVGEGTLDFRFGTTTFAGGSYDSFVENPDRASASIVIDESNNTLGGIRDAINEAGLGVVANVVDDGQGFVLVLTSDRTGEQHSMEITATESGPAGLAALNFNLAASIPGTNMTQTVDADDAAVTIDGISVTRETNSIENVVEGVTFNALALNVGLPAVVTIAEDSAAIEQNMLAFVEAFNAVKTLTDQLTDFDEDSGRGALLIGDSLVRNVRGQLRKVLGGNVAGLDSPLIRALVDIGITSDQNNGYRLKLDSSKFLSALRDNTAAVEGLLAVRGSASDASVSYVSHQAVTDAGEYDVEISTIASRGRHLADPIAFGGPITIDADNDELTVAVDGTSSGSVLLTQGVYADADALAVQIEAQINNDDALESAGRTVSVRYDATDGRFVIESSRYGSASVVAIEQVDADSQTELGFRVDDGVADRGVNVAGTINGSDANGAGQFLSLPIGPQPATSGFFNGAAVTSFDSPPLLLDGSNNTFTIRVDGVTSATVTLTPGSYASGADLAQEMQTQINADATLAGSGASVSVVYDVAASRFEVTSDRSGAQSSVDFVDVPAATATAIGFSAGSGVPGANASNASNPAAGLQIQVLGGATGPRGTVTLVRGVMDQLSRFLDSAVSFGGSVDNKIDSLDEQIEDLDEEARDFDVRMTNLETRLRIQFAAADALISELNSTAQFLDRQLSALPIFNRDRG